jgi:hypothetical protein
MIIYLGVFFALLVPELSLCGELFIPSWKVGDTWVVKAVYPVPFEKEQWSNPVFWEYQVKDQGNGSSSGNALVIEVRRKEEKNSVPALRLIYRSGDYCLLRAETTKIIRGMKTLKVLTYEGKYPVKTQQSPIPFDSPVFPLRIPSSVLFPFAKNVSEELTKTETIRQAVRKVSGLAELKDFPGGYDPKELIEVRCEDIQGNVVFSQYWDKAFGWPVYGENLNMKYWLMVTDQ